MELARFLYSHTEILKRANLLPLGDSCGPSAWRYLDYRLGFGGFLEEISLSLEETDEFPAYRGLKSLIESLTTNEQDGVYWIISTSNLSQSRIFDHVFIIEKEGENFCIVQTYVNIGDYDVCGLPLCGIDREEVVYRMENIASLFSDDRVIEWTVEDWDTWIENLGLIWRLDPPDNLIIDTPQVAWDFIPIDKKGLFTTLYQAIRNRINQGQDYLLSLLEEIPGGYYLEDNSKELKTLDRRLYRKYKRLYKVDY